MNVISKAQELAWDRHEGQCRPNRACQPKIKHIEEVVNLVSRAGQAADVIAAAWLHDIVEDTDTSLEEIRSFFGEAIEELVSGATDPVNFSRMPLAERKAAQAERLKSENLSIQIIKLCDQISNVRSVVEDPPLDWDAQKSLIYIEGAKKLVDICQNAPQFLKDEFHIVYVKGIAKYSPARI